MAKRNYRIDGLKYLLISLVIIGHYIEPSRYTVNTSLYLYSGIYFIHMPLFVMISGYFCQTQTKEKILRSSLRLLEILITVQLVEYFVTRPSLLSLFFFDSNPLWYLLCLIYWRLFAFIQDRIGITLGWQIIIAIIISILVFTLINKHEGFLAISRACQFLPYFIIGRWLRDHPISLNKQVSLGLLILSFIAVITFSSRELHILEFQRNGLFSLASQMHIQPATCTVIKLVYWLSTLFVSVYLLENAKTNHVFEKLGSYTLPIFVFQCYSSLLIRMYCSDFYLEIVLALLSIPAFTLLAQTHISCLITNPFSTIVGALKPLKNKEQDSLL